MFFPSARLLTSWIMAKKPVMKERVYWPSMPNIPLVPGGPQSNPNNNGDAAAVEEWLGYADWHQWPHTILFDSFEDLANKLSSELLQPLYLPPWLLPPLHLVHSHTIPLSPVFLC